MPEDKRDHVLAVLGELVGRTSDKGFDDLAQGARLVLNAACELWREQGKATEETVPAEAESSAGSERPSTAVGLLARCRICRRASHTGVRG